MVPKLIEFASNHYILVGLLIILLVLLLVTELRRGGRALSCGELTSLVNGGQGVVLDVRAHKEFSGGHIIDALNIPYDKLASRMAELEKFRSKTVIVVDAMGQHAGTICRDLQKAGFSVARLAGGMSTWRGDNLPVVR